MVSLTKSLFAVFIIFYSKFALASGQADPVSPVLLGLVVLFTGAKLGGYLAAKLSQPVVLGELLAGVLFGNLSLVGFTQLDFIASGEIFSILAGIGVVLLLFEVGLESSLRDLMKVGVMALVVALIGVILPFALGVAVSFYFTPGKSIYVHYFVGATLCATSVGITARVLKDMKKLYLQESQIILGAAVIDDVLGLLILAIVSGVITSLDSGSGGLGALDVLGIAGKAFAFLIGALILGTKFAPSLFRLGARLKVEGMLVSLSLSCCFLLSYIASLVGLAPIVGAFAAGLVLDGAGFPKLFNEEKSLEDLLVPISRFFVPLFFVHMGMQVDLTTLLDFKVVLFGLSLTAVAIIGKQACGLGVMGTKNLSKLTIGIGMIPRGEVGLIFASIGSQLTLAGEPVVGKSLYSAILIMVMITTLITPPALKWSINKMDKEPV
jgi:Kef-type K+ transport system membrane component KefB